LNAVESRLEIFSEYVTTILRTEAAGKRKKLMYVFVRVDQMGPNSFKLEVDDSRDNISDSTARAIESKFRETFQANK